MLRPALFSLSLPSEKETKREEKARTKNYGPFPPPEKHIVKPLLPLTFLYL